MSGIDFTAINKKLPVAKNNDEKAKRKEMFKGFDPNGNGYLSLAEVQKGIRDVLAVGEIFDAKPAIMRAFQIAKKRSSKGKKPQETKDDYIEFKEFRFFLLSLRQYFEYYVAFSRIDSSNDKRIELVEFKEAQSKIEEWVGKIDPEAEFKIIDKNGGGFILFDEFCEWAISKHLDLEDDDDDIATE